MPLTPSQLSTIFTIAGLYGDEQGWLGDAAVNELAVHIGAVVGDVYDIAFNSLLAVECLRVAQARGVEPVRKESMRQRSVELQAEQRRTPQPATPSAALNAEILARLEGDDAEALARAGADTALGLRIDNIPSGSTDAQARAGVAENKAAIVAITADDVVLAGAVGQAQAKADANETKIGVVPPPLPDVGAWIGNFQSAVQGNADAIGTLESKVDGVINDLADEVTAREESDVNPGGTLGQIYAKASATNFDGVWIDHVTPGPGGGVDPQARASAAAAQAKADANETKIGVIPAPLTNAGDWITDLGQAVQLDADEEGTLNTKINGVNNRLVDEVTAREGQGVTFTTASAQNAAHIAAEITARRAGDVALGVRIDNVVTPNYRPGVAPYQFAGSDRAAAIAAREEYFLGEVALSQAFVNIFSAGMASRIRVTLDDSTPSQVGAAGNNWNLVLGTDNPNPNVTIAPDTPAMTFTLGLPSAGITLDTLANDLDNNTRLNAEVVGNGSALVSNDATWGPGSVVGSMSPFGNGALQSTTERTAWRAVYEADQSLVLVLDYEDKEEFQHWDLVGADWESVLTLVDPPLPVWSAGSSQNLFTGATRTAAVAARDEYSLRNVGVVQATRLLPLGTSPTAGVLVTLSADNAIGAVGNSWTVIANGAAFAGSNSALAYDVVAQVVGINYNDANLTAEALAHLFNVTSGFSAELVGGISPTAIGFIAAQLAGAFSGGVNAAFNPRNVWIADYDGDGDQYITLEYGQTLERQVRRHSQWAVIDTIQIPTPTPAGVHLLTHPNAAVGENFSWWANLTSAKNEYIERTGGTIQVPEVGSQYLSIPARNSIIYFRISDGTNTAIVTLGHLVLPDGTRVASEVTVQLGAAAVTLTVEASGRVSGTQSAGGTVNTALDAWTQ